MIYKLISSKFHRPYIAVTDDNYYYYYYYYYIINDDTRVKL
jgi:hypothetical protein